MTVILIRIFGPNLRFSKSYEEMALRWRFCVQKSLRRSQLFYFKIIKWEFNTSKASKLTSATGAALQIVYFHAFIGQPHLANCKSILKSKVIYYMHFKNYSKAMFWFSFSEFATFTDFYRKFLINPDNKHWIWTLETNRDNCEWWGKA